MSSTDALARQDLLNSAKRDCNSLLNANTRKGTENIAQQPLFLIGNPPNILLAASKGSQGGYTDQVGWLGSTVGRVTSQQHRRGKIKSCQDCVHIFARTRG